MAVPFGKPYGRYGNLADDGRFGYLFPDARTAERWQSEHCSQKNIFISPGGEVWIGDTPGEGWAELSARELEKAAYI